MPACAAAHEQELGIDPLRRDAEGFRWRTRSQIEEERSWLWVEDGVILFKAEASAWTPGAVQLQQVWVDPQVRRRGYGARGLADLCRLLLERSRPCACSSGRRTTPAISLYEAIGMDARARLPLAPVLTVERSLLARHAFAGSNRDGIASCAVPGEGLTPEGVEQARSLVGALLGGGDRASR